MSKSTDVLKKIRDLLGIQFKEDVPVEEVVETTPIEEPTEEVELQEEDLVDPPMEEPMPEEPEIDITEILTQMAMLEERIAALEGAGAEVVQENAELKKEVEKLQEENVELSKQPAATPIIPGTINDKSTYADKMSAFLSDYRKGIR